MYSLILDARKYEFWSTENSNSDKSNVSVKINQNKQRLPFWRSSSLFFFLYFCFFSLKKKRFVFKNHMKKLHSSYKYTNQKWMDNTKKKRKEKRITQERPLKTKNDDNKQFTSKITEGLSKVHPSRIKLTAYTWFGNKRR